MARIKVTGFMDVDDELVDKDHTTGLTQLGFEAVQRMFLSLDDMDTTLVEEKSEPAFLQQPKRKSKGYLGDD